MLDKSPSSSKSASDKGAAASLKCSAAGAPDVSFTWVRMGAAVAGEGVAAEGDKYAVTDTQVDRSVLGQQKTFNIGTLLRQARGIIQ